MKISWKAGLLGLLIGIVMLRGGAFLVVSQIKMVAVVVALVLIYWQWQALFGRSRGGSTRGFFGFKKG